MTNGKRDFVTIEGKALLPALNLMCCVIEKRNTYPILGMMKLAVAGSYLTLRATDLDVELTASLDVIDAGGDWDICVDPTILFKIAKLAGSTTLELHRMTAEQLVVRAGIATYDLDGLASDSHPTIGGKRGEAIETFTAGRLCDLVGKVQWCRSVEETRYYLNGVAWQLGARGRRFAATDGHRLAICRYDELPIAAEVTRIIPNKTVDLMLSLPGNVVVRHVRHETSGENDPLKLEAEAGNFVLRSKLIEGMGANGGYPDIDRVIPGANMRKARFVSTRDELIGALDRALVFEGRAGGMAIKFAPAAGCITIGVKRPDKGGAVVTLPSSWPEHGETFGANGRYLHTAIRSCAPGEVSIWQVDASAPMTILDADETMLRLVMPMRV